MIEAEKLREAQDFITRELQKQGVGRIDAISWNQGPWDPAAGIYRLIVYRDGEKSSFTFTKYELIKNYGSQQWAKDLRVHISDILMEF